MITKFGLQYIRPLTPEENYSEESRSLYGIWGTDLEVVLKKFIKNGRKLMGFFVIQMVSQWVVFTEFPFRKRFYAH